MVDRADDGGASVVAVVAGTAATTVDPDALAVVVVAVAVDAVKVDVPRRPTDVDDRWHRPPTVTGSVVYRPVVVDPYCWHWVAVAIPSVDPCGVVDPSVDALPDRFRNLGRVAVVVALDSVRHCTHPCAAGVASGS